MIILLLILFPFVYQNAREAGVRDSSRLMQHALWAGADRLQAYRRIFGHYPPGNTSGTVYLPLTRELLQPVDFDVLSTFSLAPGSVADFYSGPPIDPYRCVALFPNESKAAAHCLGHDGNAGGRGYPLRYYRGPGWALLISNGPDEELDIGPDQLRNVGGEVSTVYDYVLLHRYDPTNGTLSSGDCFRIVEPP